MNTHTINSFHVAGISVRTTNENGQAMQDIPALWNRFMSENIAEKIPGKTSQTIYCIYTDYEKDHTRPYTTIIGCQVENLDELPAGIVGKTFEESIYTSFTAKGDLSQGIVYKEWMKIWNEPLRRAFTTDFEVYSEKAHDPKNAEVDIFIAIQ